MRLTFAFFGVKYTTLKSLKISEHGRMEDESYQKGVLKYHLSCFEKNRANPTFCGVVEIGPGDSLDGYRELEDFGFSSIYFVDKGSQIVEKTLNSYKRRGDGLYEVGKNIYYLTRGATSLSQIQDRKIEFCYSQSVLQHIPEQELGSYFDQLKRIMVLGGIQSHVINHTDHLSGEFLVHKWPKIITEGKYWSRANLYTNGLDISWYISALEERRFQIIEIAVEIQGKYSVIADKKDLQIKSQDEKFKRSRIICKN